MFSRTSCKHNILNLEAFLEQLVNIAGIYINENHVEHSVNTNYDNYGYPVFIIFIMYVFLYQK